MIKIRSKIANKLFKLAAKIAPDKKEK